MRKLATCILLSVLISGEASAAVVVNEVMYHPYNESTSGKYEFIELYNTGNAAVSLTGWVLTTSQDFTSVCSNLSSTSDNKGYFVIPTASIPAHGFFTLWHSAITGVTDQPNNLVYSPARVRTLTLADTTNSQAGELISLLQCTGNTPTLVDQLNYSVSSQIGGVPALGLSATPENVSLERIAADCPAQSGSNWALSTASPHSNTGNYVVGGTPGATNSVAGASCRPLVSFVEPATGAVVTTNLVPVSVHVDSISTISSVTVNGTPAVQAAGLWTASVVVPDGDSTLTATATDSQGNQGQASVGITSVRALAAARIGPLGGTVTVPAGNPLAGSYIQVPPGAVSSNTVFSIAQLDPAPPMNRAAGVGSAVSLAPSGVPFSTPVTVGIRYHDALVRLIQERAAGVQLYHFDTASSGWSLAGGSASTANEQVVANLSEFVPSSSGAIYQVGSACPDCVSGEFIGDPTSAAMGDVDPSGGLDVRLDPAWILSAPSGIQFFVDGLTSFEAGTTPPARIRAIYSSPRTMTGALSNAHIATLAGTLAGGSPLDGTAPLAAELPAKVTLGQDPLSGTLYIADATQWSVRSLGVGQEVSTVGGPAKVGALNFAQMAFGIPTPSTQVDLQGIQGISVAPSGAQYLSNGPALFRLMDNRVTLVAGNPSCATTCPTSGTCPNCVGPAQEGPNGIPADQADLTQGLAGLTSDQISMQFRGDLLYFVNAGGLGIRVLNTSGRESVTGYAQAAQLFPHAGPNACGGAPINVPDGYVKTIAGYQGSGASGDGSFAANAQFTAATSIAVDRAGNIFVTDRGSGRIRVIDGDTGCVSSFAPSLIAQLGDGPEVLTWAANPSAQVTASSPEPFGLGLGAWNNDLFVSMRGWRSIVHIWNNKQTGAVNSNDPNGDSDGDGIPNQADLCPLNPTAPQVDTDGDGLGDACDPCPLDPRNDQDHDGVCSPLDKDSDGDGIADSADNCPYVLNPDQRDGDGDGIGDLCDNCPSVWNPDQKDTTGSGTGDACKACVYSQNSGQTTSADGGTDLVCGVSLHDVLASNSGPPSSTTIQRVHDLRHNMLQWVQICGHTATLFGRSGFVNFCDSGDALLMNGLLCLSGEQFACEGVRNAQNRTPGQPSSGQWARSEWWWNNGQVFNDVPPGNVDPDPVHHTAFAPSYTFSRDHALGAIAYLIATGDSMAASMWQSFITSGLASNSDMFPSGGGFSHCIYSPACSTPGDPTCDALACGFARYPYDHAWLCTSGVGDNRCEVTDEIWDLMGRTWPRLNLPLNGNMTSAVARDGVASSSFFPFNLPTGNYTLENSDKNLVAVNAFLLRSLGVAEPGMSDAINKVAGDFPNNEFYQFLQNGATEGVGQLILNVCPANDPGDAARTHYDHWYCVLTMNLYLSSLSPPILPEQISSTVQILPQTNDIGPNSMRIIKATNNRPLGTPQATTDSPDSPGVFAGAFGTFGPIPNAPPFDFASLSFTAENSAESFNVQIAAPLLDGTSATVAPATWRYSGWNILADKAALRPNESAQLTVSAWTDASPTPTVQPYWYILGGDYGAQIYPQPDGSALLVAPSDMSSLPNHTMITVVALNGDPLFPWTSFTEARLSIELKYAFDVTPKTVLIIGGGSRQFYPDPDVPVHWSFEGPSSTWWGSMGDNSPERAALQQTEEADSWTCFWDALGGTPCPAAILNEMNTDFALLQTIDNTYHSPYSTAYRTVVLRATTEDGYEASVTVNIVPPAEPSGTTSGSSPPPNPGSP